jgi:antirestriction protein
MVEEFHMKCIEYSSSAFNVKDTDYAEMYGGGRKGQQDEAREYGSDYDSEAREAKAKKETNDLIQKQFALRRSSQVLDDSLRESRDWGFLAGSVSKDDREVVFWQVASHGSGVHF